jgi:hypothetical protein
LLTVRYEDPLDAPEATLRRLIAYVVRAESAVDASFFKHAAALVHGPASRWQDLDTRDRLRLEAACNAGFEALADRGYLWA